MEGSITTPSLTLDLSESKDDEESYEIRLIGEQSKNINEKGDDTKSLTEDSEPLPEWSVSEISCASGLNAPDRFHTDFEPSSASASAWSSPEKVTQLKGYSARSGLLETESISQGKQATIVKNETSIVFQYQN